MVSLHEEEELNGRSKKDKEHTLWNLKRHIPLVTVTRLEASAFPSFYIQYNQAVKQAKF